ncbi:hypothetical protein CCHR01_15099 [Colletotrichum chrysophilum]|uniref:Uncharacterized protein n=1 Tax=Colletotrichum chrysophilum TaxID=1836956 RepID=A0AAD9A696_9PEZI|nr:hypothetical protein CCHR01_15099 [Colletotrichum chrysophilum]
MIVLGCDIRESIVDELFKLIFVFFCCLDRAMLCSCLVVGCSCDQHSGQCGFGHDELILSGMVDG